MDNVCKGNLKVKANKRNSRRRRARSVWKNPRRVATLAGSIFFFFFVTGLTVGAYSTLIKGPGQSQQRNA